MSEKTFKFIKQQNGNVLLLNAENGEFVTSFIPSMTIKRDKETRNRFEIMSVLLDYNDIVDTACSPVIVATNFDAFLIELSEKFFFLNKKGSSDCKCDCVVAFGDLELKAKGVNNCIPNTGTELEIGDIVTGWKNINIYWDAAQYKGGLVSDKENYEPIFEADMGTKCAIPVIDAVVSAWSAWSGCDAGSQTRTRTVITPASGGGNTPSLIETQNCTIPVDAAVSAWSAWSSCNAGSQTRTRTIVTPASGGGNTPSLLETQACVMPDASYTCESITFPGSNYTGEDLHYSYIDCDTGIFTNVTVYYGQPDVTVNRRVYS